MDKDENGGKAAKHRLVVSMTGIECITCSLAIEKQVKKIEGVKDIKSSLMLNKVYIDYDPNLVDENTIKKAIDKTGYKSNLTVEDKKEH